MTASNLNVFLKLANKNLKSLPESNEIKRTINVIIGNESCDLDSAICSIVYSYFLYWSQLKSSPMCDDLYVPIMNIEKCDMALKTEVVYYFRQNNISTDEIVCRNEIDLVALKPLCKLCLTLVDHHILSERYKQLINNVVQIFDHRPKDDELIKYDASTDINISIVGSCSTLISLKILSHPLGNEFFKDNIDCAHLINGTIVLDTVNFSQSADKARPLDIEMSQMLENILNISNQQTYREKIFNELLHARIDHSSLNAFQLLKRDLKIINNIPIPGFPMLVKNYLSKEDCERALKEFSEENNSPVLILMGLEINNGLVTRDIGVYSIDKNNAERKHLENGLISSVEPNLNLQEKIYIKDCTHFNQLNTKASRKQIIPIVKRILDSLASA